MKRFKATLITLLFTLAMIMLIQSCTKSKFEKEEKYTEWKKSIIKLRIDKDKEFKTSPTSPMAGTERFTFNNKKSVWLGMENGKIKAQTSKFHSALLKFDFTNGNWEWSKIKGNFIAKLSGCTINPGLLEDETTFKIERFTLQTYSSPKSIVIIVFDPQRKEIKEFQHLYYYPPNHDYVVNARFERLTDLKKVKMVTSRNLIKTFYRYALIHFQLNGEKITLSAFKSSLKGKYSDTLFIPFQDKTTGMTTYPAGRYLEIKEPAGNKIEVDFNKSFNPLCNYSHAYNCPVPPPENICNIAIEAGEKIYPH